MFAAGGGPSNSNNHWNGHTGNTSDADVEEVVMNLDPPPVSTSPEDNIAPEVPKIQDDFTDSLARSLEESDKTRETRPQHQQRESCPRGTLSTTGKSQTSKHWNDCERE